MAQMATTAGPGGTSQSTITTPGLALQDPNDFVRFAYAMALRRRQQQQAQEAPVMRSEPVQRAPISMRSDSTGNSDQKAVDYMDARRRIIEDQEASAPPPLRMINGGPGISQGWTQDVNAMDANQRKLFLPQSSTLSSAAIDQGGPAGGGGGKDPLADPYSDAYRSMIDQGYSAADIAQIRQQNLSARRT